MSTTGTASRPLLPLVIFVVAAAWAVSSGLILAKELDFLAEDYFPSGRYGLYFAGWVLSDGLGVLGIAPAIAGLWLPRAAWWLLGVTVVSTLADVAATIGLYVIDFSSLGLGTALRLSYLTPFKGENGWESVTSVLSFWLALPLGLLCLVRLLSSRSATPAPAPVAAPTPAQTMPVAPADQWYVMTAGTAYGPYTWPQLMAYGEEGRVTPATLVRRGQEPVVPLSTLLQH